MWFWQENKSIGYAMRFLIFFLCFSVTCVFAASHHPTDFLQSIQGSEHEGAAIVEHFCGSCHAAKPVIPLGAPRPKITQDWLPRIGQGMDVLFKHSSEGLRAMPPRGGCFECTDEQLMLAIKALLPDEKAPEKD